MIDSLGKFESALAFASDIPILSILFGSVMQGHLVFRFGFDGFRVVGAAMWGMFDVIHISYSVLDIFIDIFAFKGNIL